MEEATFRAVRLCQSLGSHTRFRILLLLSKGRMTPGEIETGYHHQNRRGQSNA